MPKRLPTWVDYVVLALAGVSMAIATWGTWADVLIDYGRELYVPWQLTEGKALDRDLAWFNGPLSAYANGGLFAVFGASVATLTIANAVVLGAVTWMLHCILVRAAGRFAALVACLTLLVVFAFAEDPWVANFNWLAPYSHEVTHGIALGLAAASPVLRVPDDGRTRVTAACGLALGLCFLTKPEVFLAAALAVCVGLWLAWRGAGGGMRNGLRSVGVVAAFALAPIVVALLLLATAMPFADAAYSALGGWLFVGDERLAALRYYREVMGLADWPASVARIWFWTKAHAAVFAPAAWIALALRGRRGARLAVPVAVAVLVGVVVVITQFELVWAHAVSPLPFVLAATLIGLAVALRSRRADAAAVRRLGAALVLGVFALALLAKQGLNARIQHYGFALAMPGTLLGVVLLVEWLPQCCDRLGGRGIVFRAAALGVVAMAWIGLLVTSASWQRHKVHAVGHGADAILADGRGAMVEEVLKELARRAGPRDTLAVLPEGVTLNFWTRRVNPTPFVNLMPPEVIMFGEQRIVAAYRAAPPDWLVLAHKDTSEYGFASFGNDYLQELGAWIGRTYDSVMLVGSPPFVDGRFGLLLMRKRAGAK